VPRRRRQLRTANSGADSCAVDSVCLMCCATRLRQRHCRPLRVSHWRLIARFKAAIKLIHPVGGLETVFSTRSLRAVARRLPRRIHCVRTQEMLRFTLLVGGELRHSSRPVRDAVCRGATSTHSAERTRTMAVSWPARTEVLSATVTTAAPASSAVRHRPTRRCRRRGVADTPVPAPVCRRTVRGQSPRGSSPTRCDVT